LVNLGVDPHHRDSEGKTPIEMAQNESWIAETDLKKIVRIMSDARPSTPSGKKRPRRDALGL
jgi:hypothetical protein